MSLENAKRFIDAASKDQSIQQRLGAASEPSEAVRIAVQAGSERGLPFTAEEFLTIIGPRAGDGGGDLSDDELESVSGGIGGFVGRFLSSLGSSPSQQVDGSLMDRLWKELHDSTPPSGRPPD